VTTGVSVSAGQRSDIQINPDTPEAQALRQWYDFEGRTASTQHAGEGLANARSAPQARFGMSPSVYARLCSDAFLCVHARDGLYSLIAYLGLNFVHVSHINRMLTVHYPQVAGAAVVQVCRSKW